MNNQSDQNEIKELLSIIRAVLHGSRDTGNSEAVDYVGLLQIAKRNSVANTVADVICNNSGVPSDIQEEFQKQKMIVAAQQTLADNHINDLYYELDKQQVKGLFLKGTLLRSLYPGSFLRSMSDVDVYSDESDMDKIFHLMTSSGYEPGTIGLGNHYEYRISRYVKVEYHPELVTLESEYGKVFHKLHPEAESIAAYMDIWNHTISIDDHEFARQLVPEYHYLYVIMHMTNHFLGGGTGIRSIMDIWVMNQHYCEKWNREEIEELLADYGLLTFEKFALALADKWFEFDEIKYIPKALSEGDGINSSELEQFEDYILSSGTYGDLNQTLARQLDYDTGKTNQIRFIFSRFFLPYKTMKNIYPVLEKAPVLLPVYWPYRVIEMFSKRGKAAKGKMKAVRTMNSDKAERQKALFEMVMR